MDEWEMRWGLEVGIWGRKEVPLLPLGMRDSTLFPSLCPGIQLLLGLGKKFILGFVLRRGRALSVWR